MTPTLKISLPDSSQREARTQAGAPGRACLEISVVIPCLNEEHWIGACIDKAIGAFEAAGIFGEVVVADNGSNDHSVEVAERHGARVVHTAVKGYGSALRKGIE